MDDMTPIVDAELLTEFSIMLKLAPRYMVRDMMAKLPHERDRASEVLAQYVIGKLAESRVRLYRLRPRRPFNGFAGWSGDQETS